jgi:NTE family protein
MTAQTRAFVLGGGGMLGAAEVGMLQALLERGLVPDLVVGSSVGALNGVALAAEPTLAAVHRLADSWVQLGSRDVFSGSLVGQLATVARHGTYLHENGSLRKLIVEAAGDGVIEDLPVTFQCVASSIEAAGAHWFDRGPIAEAVLASCAVPGLFPPVRVGDEHFLDGGLVRSVPVGRAVDLGAGEIYVLHVGRIEQPLRVPRRPWEVATVAFEIARRHQLGDDLGRVPPGLQVHLLPTGGPAGRTVSLRSRRSQSGPERIRLAHSATAEYLDRLAL